MNAPLYVYGLIRAGDGARAGTCLGAVRPAAGLGPPVVVPLGALAILASEVASGGAPAEFLPTRRNMLAHARVLEAVLAAVPVLPVSFGHVSPGAGALGDTLGGREAELIAAIERLEGRAEYGVHVEGDRNGAIRALVAEEPGLARAFREAADGPAGHFARVELGRRVAEGLARRRDAAQARLLAALRAAAEDHVLKAPEQDTDLLRAAFLLPMSAEDAFAAMLEAAAADLDFAPDVQARVRLIGPAPASHFVSIRMDGPAPVPAAAG